MNDKQLRSFMLLAQEGSMNRAAEKAFLSVPSLKKQMDLLEAELQVQLFVRSNRGVRLTEQGKVFLEFVQQTAQAWRSVQKKLAPREDCIRIGYNSDQMRDFVYYRALQFFKERFPDIKVTLEEAEIFEPSSFDLFLGYCDETDEQVGKSFLGQLPLHCIVNKKDLLAGKKEIRVQDLKGKDVFIPPKFVQEKITPRLKEELYAAGVNSIRENTGKGSAYIINAYVSNGISIVAGKETERAESVSQIPLLGFAYEYHIFYAKRSIKREIVQEYIRSLQLGYSRILDKSEKENVSR